MTRDPSDGAKPDPTVKVRQAVRGNPSEKLRSQSGLPIESAKSKDIVKLDKSRAWLEQYHQGKLNARNSDDEQQPGPAAKDECQT